MNTIADALEAGYNLIKDYKSLNIKTGLINEFPVQYEIPYIRSIKYQKGKSILQMHPSEYEYLLYHLHDTDELFVYRVFVGYLHYWKIRKKDTKKMLEKYKEIVNHYKVTHDCDIPTVAALPSVYYISFYVGSVKVYKFGYSNEPTRRFKEIINSVKEHYPLVSIGSFECISLITYETEKEALKMEAKLIEKSKEKGIPKSRIYFKGGTEGFSKSIKEYMKKI